MPKTIRNKYYEYLTYEKLMEAHIKSRKGKGNRKVKIHIYTWNIKNKRANRNKRNRICIKMPKEYILKEGGTIWKKIIKNNYKTKI